MPFTHHDENVPPTQSLEPDTTTDLTPPTHFNPLNEKGIHGTPTTSSWDNDRPLPPTNNNFRPLPNLVVYHAFDMQPRQHPYSVAHTGTIYYDAVTTHHYTAYVDDITTNDANLISVKNVKALWKLSREDKDEIPTAKGE